MELVQLPRFADIPPGNPGLTQLEEIIANGDRGLVFGRSSTNGVGRGKIPGYWTCPYNGTITGAYLSCDQGGFTVNIWKAGRPFNPISSDSINTEGLRIRTPATHIELFDLRDFKNLDVVTGDTFAVEVKAVFPPFPTDIAGSVVILPVGSDAPPPGVITPPSLGVPIPPALIIPPGSGGGVWYPSASGPAQATGTALEATSQSVDVRHGYSTAMDFLAAPWVNVASGTSGVQVIGTGPITVIGSGGSPAPIPPQAWRITTIGSWLLSVNPSQVGPPGASSYPAPSGLWVALDQGPQQILAKGSGPIRVPGKFTGLNPWRILANGPWVLATH